MPSATVNRTVLALAGVATLALGAGFAGLSGPAAAVPTAAAHGAAAQANTAKKKPGNGSPKVTKAPTSLTGLSPELPKSVVRASSNKHTWRPEKAKYGTASKNDIAVEGAKHTTIRVNEIYPTTKNGKEAKGKFPVVMTMTPYGKGQGGSSKPGSASQPGGGSATGGANNYLVERGYIDVVEDVRGTGDSGGSWGLFDPIQQRDNKKVLHWAAHIKHSDGRVGTYGPSYLGIDQLLLGGSVGRHSPLKAMFPMVPADDSYRDTAFMGGLLDFEFSETYLGLTGSLNTSNPATDSASDPQLLKDLAGVEADHAKGLAGYDAAITRKILTDGPDAYDQRYWLRRAPQKMFKRIVRNRIPAYLVGGEFDIFQHGEPIDFAELQNGWDHRSVTAKMKPGQRTTGRYQLIDGPWEHLNGSSVDVDRLELEWFDTWLKHEHTGMAHTKTPLHYYDLGTGKFRETTTYPFTGTTPHKFYLGNSKSLRSRKAKSTKAAGSNSIVWSDSGDPCNRQVDQWALGGVSIPAHTAGVMAPCADANGTSQHAPYEVNFNSKPFKHRRTISGPITANLFATSTTKETQLVAQVDIVNRDGSSYPLTEGALLGSLRKIDQHRSWRSHGVTTMPFHPLTMKSQRAVKPGKLTRFDVEIFPTLATIPRGDRLRVTISTVDTPHLVPVPKQITQLTGGVYDIEHSKKAPSSLIVELGKPKH